MDNPPAPAPKEPERGITRADLEQVIRRAAELYTREADSSDRLSEGEVLKVAAELGLPDRLVRQALYELPATPDEGGRVQRWYGEPRAAGSRVVPGTPDDVMRRLEEYLATREFLQLLRRQGHRAIFTPADDTISSVARAMKRPQGQWQIARSDRVLVEVRPIPEAESHVGLELDLRRQRARALRGGIAGGAILGLPVAAMIGVPIGAVTFELIGGPAAAIAAVTTGAGALGASISAGMAIGRNRFRARCDRARVEIASLLDRLETGGRLDPPPAPWLRSLRARISDTLRGPEPRG